MGCAPSKENQATVAPSAAASNPPPAQSSGQAEEPQSGAQHKVSAQTEAAAAPRPEAAAKTTATPAQESPPPASTTLQNEDDVAELPPPGELPTRALSIAAPTRTTAVKMARREAVSAERDEVDKDFVPPVYSKSTEVRDRIVASIEHNPLFTSLRPEQLDTIVMAMQEEHVTLHTEVIVEGEESGDTCYVVGSGKFAAYKGKKQLVTYQPGELFGELAVMYGCKRAATILCEEPGTLWSLDRKTFKNILKGTYASTTNTASEYLKTVPMLADLTDDQRLKVTEALTSVKYSAGDSILRHGDVGTKLFIVKEGEVAATRDDGTELAVMKQGEFFGESALDGSKEPRKANVIARSDVEVLSISASDFEGIIGSLTEVLANNLNQRIIDGIELLSYLSRSQRKELVENLKLHRVAKDTVLLEQGQPGTSFYIIKSGECVVTQTQGGSAALEIATLETSGYFGERSLLKDEPCNATVTAKTDCVLLRLGRAEFDSLLGKNLQQIIDDEIQHRERLARAAQEANVRFEDLESITTLGEGSFGRVKLIRHVPSGRAMALKCLRKGQLIKYKQVEHVVGEKAVMLACQHPFVLRLEAVFQTRYEVHMLLELCLGGELFSLLRLAGRLEEAHARFYSAVVVSAFGYLHERDVCHRDLKPENLLFDEQGYLKLVDMGFAKVVKDKTWTLCGTPEYLAPEIVGNKGHNHAVDWWTLGVLLFEMVSGYPPFAGQDQMETYQKIMRGKVRFPSGLSAPCKDCIARLLAQNPAQRLGVLKGGTKDVKSHDFFKPIDFHKLEAKEIDPPFVPKVKDSFDTSNYDKYPDDSQDAAYWKRYCDDRYDPIWERNFGKMLPIDSF